MKTMTLQSTAISSRAHWGALALLGAATMASLPAARAGIPDLTPSSVVTGDTFSIETIVYNTTDPSGHYNETDPTLDPTFGTTTTYQNAAATGPETLGPLTVSSYETKAGGLTTDSITISVPTNFVPTTEDNNGNLANAMEFSIGLYNNGTDPLSFDSKLTNVTVSGSCNYTFNGQTKTAQLTHTVMGTYTGFSAEEAVQSFDPTIALRDYDITSFNFTVTYGAVPEPSTAVAVLAGAAGLVGLTLRRRRHA